MDEVAITEKGHAMRPMFSIMVPVYNMERYLDECIQSVVNQTMHDYELLLVDDGSTDRSGEICDRYEREYPNIRVYHKPNAGLLKTRRYALVRATGEYDIFLDADDSLQPEALSVIADTIRTTECDCVIYGYRRVDAGNVIDTSNGTFPPKIICDKAELYQTVFFDSRYNCLWRKAVKAELIDGNRFSEEGSVVFAEDLLQSIEIYKNAEKTAIIPDLLYNYRLNASSITQTVSHKNFDYKMRAREKVLLFLNEEDVFSRKEMDAYYMFCWKTISRKILEICGLAATKSDKIALLKAVREQPYTQSVMERVSVCGCGKKLEQILLRLYRAKWYDAILMLSKLYHRMKKK